MKLVDTAESAAWRGLLAEHAAVAAFLVGGALAVWLWTRVAAWREK